jgi:hypothetical protein
MNKFKDKLQVFIVGFAFGLLVAGGFFILKLDNYFKELNFYKTLSSTFSSEVNKKSEAKETTDNADKITEAKGEKKILQKTKKGNDSLDMINTTGEKNTDTLYALQTKDTATMHSYDEVVVKKDELINTRVLEINNLNAMVLKNTKDSSLQKVSGIQDERLQIKDFTNIEFWQSPLNYKGYKNTRYKLVLYGIAPNENIKLYRLDDNLYLKNQNTVYRIESTSDFKSYDKVTDDALISKLK